MDHRKKRRRLFYEWMNGNHRCHWCGHPTVLIMRPPKADDRTEKVRVYKSEATLDHLRSRLDPTRADPQPIIPEKRIVLSCWKCNNERAKEEDDRLTVEERRERASKSKKRIPRTLEEWQQLQKLRYENAGIQGAT